jgi:hypothetical protein
MAERTIARQETTTWKSLAAENNTTIQNSREDEADRNVVQLDHKEKLRRYVRYL